MSQYLKTMPGDQFLEDSGSELSVVEFFDQVLEELGYEVAYCEGDATGGTEPSTDEWMFTVAVLPK
jgi:hypothetical protein